MKFYAMFDEGPEHIPEAKRFAHYIGNVRYWFAYHKAPNGVDLSVSHWESGKRAATAPCITIAACLGDAKAAAKMALDKLVEKHGAERVQVVLNSAPILVKPKA